MFISGMEIVIHVQKLRFKTNYLMEKKTEGSDLPCFSCSSIGMWTEKDSCNTICKKIHISRASRHSPHSFKCNHINKNLIVSLLKKKKKFLSVMSSTLFCWVQLATLCISWSLLALTLKKTPTKPKPLQYDLRNFSVKKHLTSNEYQATDEVHLWNDWCSVYEVY